MVRFKEQTYVKVWANNPRMKIDAVILAVILAVALPHAALAAGGPDPCGPAPDGAPGQAARVQSWTPAQLGAGWVPPACSGWATPGFRSLVAVTGALQLTGGTAAVLARLGGVSGTVGVRYWSVSKKAWEPLITAAQATGPGGQPRTDFSPAEMVPGAVLSYSQTDTGSGTVQYRMQVREAGPNRVVLMTENATTIRAVLVPLFSAGELQTLTVVSRTGRDVWAYSSLTRTGPGASRLTDGHEASAINRAVAMFRHVAGVPTDQEPPAAR